MFCNYCGVPNPDDAAFCRACGKRIALGPQSDSSSTSASPSSVSNAPPPAGVTPVTTVSARPSGSTSSGAIWAVFVLLLAIVAGVAFVVYHELTPQSTDVSSAAPLPTYTPPPVAPRAVPALAPAPAQEIAPPPAAPAVEPPPAPEPAPAPAPPQNSIVGRWTTNVPIGTSTLELTADGHYHVKNVFADDSGVYVYSSSDGTLRLQEDGIFSHDITIWHCQLSGDTLSVVEPEGAAHVYTRY